MIPTRVGYSMGYNKKNTSIGNKELARHITTTQKQDDGEHLTAEPIDAPHKEPPPRQNKQ